MKTLAQALKVEIEEPVVIRSYICEGCKREVDEVEMTHLLGPYRGQKFRIEQGCNCDEIKMIQEAIEEDRKSRIESLKKKFERDSFINASLKKASFETYTPPTPELQSAKTILMSYATNFDKDNPCNLLLVGPYGTGKSHLSVSTTKLLMDKGYSCLFLSVPKMLTKIRESYNKQSNFSEAEFMRYIEQVDLLVLDDIGAEYGKKEELLSGESWSQSKLFEVLDGRAGKHTIYTTNLNSKSLEERLNSRNFSRLLDNTQIVVMNGPDFRKKTF